MLGVDERGMSRLRALDVGTGCVCALIEGDRDRNEAALTQLVVQRLPDRQVLATASPRGPRDQQRLLAALVAERVQVPVEIGQREIGGRQRGESNAALGRRGTEDGDALVDVERERAIERAGERREIETVRGHERRPVTHRDADVAATQALLLEPPPEAGRERMGRDADRVGVHGDVQGHHTPLVDERHPLGRHTSPLRPPGSRLKPFPPPQFRVDTTGEQAVLLATIMTRAAALVLLAAALSPRPRAAHAACSPADLAGSSAIRCAQAHLAALNRCRRTGTPVATCAAQVRSAACDRLPRDCRPATQIYSILAAAGLPGPRDPCRTRLTRASFKLLKRGLARGRSGTLGALSRDVTACTETALKRCDATPELAAPCQGLASREDAAACACNLALPVLPVSIAFLPAGCPSRFASAACASATAITATCHEAFVAGGGDFCIAGHGARATYAPQDQPAARGSSFPIRPRARAFNGPYPEATGAVSATSDGVGPAGSVVGASDEGHLRLTAPLLTTRLLVLRWHTGDHPDGVSTRLRVAAGEQVLGDEEGGPSAPEERQVTALVSWQGDLDLTVSALVNARRDRAVASADLAWRLGVLDPTADDDVDGTTNAPDPGPLERTLPAAPSPSTRPRVLLIGLDGAGWNVLDPLIDAGYLPTIGSLVRGGAWAKLDERGNGNDCCYCPPVWSSIATGRPRKEHHMLNLDDEPFDRPVPAIWTVLAANGGTTTQVSYRNTFPVEPGVTYDLTEPGLQVAGRQLFDAQQTLMFDDALDRLELTWPPRLFETLGVLPASGPRVKAWNIFAIDRTSVEALARLAATAPTDLTMWILHSVDKSEHLMWGTVQSALDQPVDVATILTQASYWTGPLTGGCCNYTDGFQWGDVASQYLEAEQHVTRILAAAHYDYVVLASDHTMTLNPVPGGLPGIHTIPPTFDGIFAISGPGIVPGHDLGTVSLLDVAPTLAYLLDLPVADDLPGDVVTAAFAADQLAAKPIRRVASWTSP